MVNANAACCEQTMLLERFVLNNVGLRVRSSPGSRSCVRARRLRRCTQRGQQFGARQCTNPLVLVAHRFEAEIVSLVHPYRLLRRPVPPPCGLGVDPDIDQLLRLDNFNRGAMAKLRWYGRQRRAAATSRRPPEACRGEKSNQLCTPAPPTDTQTDRARAAQGHQRSERASPTNACP